MFCKNRSMRSMMMMMVVFYKEINTIRTTCKIIKKWNNKINVIIRKKLVRLGGRDKQGRYSALSCVFNYDWNWTDFSGFSPLCRLLFLSACLPAFLINLFSSIYFRGNHKAAHKDKSQVKLASLRYIHIQMYLFSVLRLMPLLTLSLPLLLLLLLLRPLP